MEELIANSIIQKLGCSAPRSRSDSWCFIQRVPDILHKMTELSAYTPRAVSIGPYHRGKKSLKAIEDRKLSFIHNLLNRAAKMKFRKEEIVERTGGEETRLVILKDCIAAIKNREPELRECYPIELKSEEFVENMVVDGLFTIEYFNTHVMKGYEDIDDPLSGKTWLKSMLYWDFLLLENQIPISVLMDLFQLTTDEATSGADAFYQLVLGYLRLSNFPGTDYIHIDIKDLQRYGNTKHLLDVFTIALHPHPTIQIIPETTGTCKISVPIYSCMPGAVELNRSGVRFKKRSSALGFLDIKFNNGIFEIPHLTIEDNTDRWLRNLIAFEQFSYKRSAYVISYAILMDSLISSAEDVELLRKKGILTTHLGSDEKVANMFNKLCNHINDFDGHYSQIFVDVDRYYKKRQHKWKATLKRDYFHNPWSILSFLAAVLLILLTVTSTVFTILARVVPKP
ncbi:hypothetical protein MKX01_042549 [Papaver californicum]|nr:hypothetical protein MKX01_042549 [Papaver californicum]